MIDDDLGRSGASTTDRFVKRYDTLSARIQDAARDYAADVRARRFPEAQHLYG